MTLPVPLPPGAAPLPIAVWRFEDAPAYLQAVSTNGGDEDWLAVVPVHLVDEWIPWLEVGAFGLCSVDRFDHPKAKGYKVVIGSHA